jgi:ferredoxin/flavodoxin---NADP+ reductase
MHETSSFAESNPVVSGSFNREIVLSVRRWTDTLFSFTTTRPPGFDFTNGQFALISPDLDPFAPPQALGIASPDRDDVLEFLCGSEQPQAVGLQQLKPGDKLMVGRRARGKLVLNNLKQGTCLYLLGSGIGIASFLSIVRDRETYERFPTIVLVHAGRRPNDLSYSQSVVANLEADPVLRSSVRSKLIYYPLVATERSRAGDRIVDLLASREFFGTVNLPPFARETDRIMMCGSEQMLYDLKLFFDVRGFIEGSALERGDYVTEKAFVEH